MRRIYENLFVTGIQKKVLLNNLGDVVFKATNLLSFWDIRIVIDSQFFLFLRTYM
jgi:hypothetical protein